MLLFGVESAQMRSVGVCSGGALTEGYADDKIGLMHL